MGMLILTQPGNRANTYGAYTTAVLKAEGFADMVVRPIGQESLAGLEAYDAVILTPCLPRRAYVDRLAAYVKAGGRLIALRPSRLVALALGLAPTSTVVHPAYVRPLPGNAISAGVPHESVQTHVPVDNYEPLQLPEGTQEIARTFADAGVETSYPAALHFPLGKGQVVAFGYDLAQAVALIRQGNPVHYGWRTLGFGNPYRPNEFYSSHLDKRRMHLPQADIHTMLLGNAVNAIAKHPQPRLWYYDTPDTKSMVVLDSDDDYSPLEAFEALMDSVEAHDGHITIYLMLGPSKYTIATPERVAGWRARGHSFGIHHNAFDPHYADEEQDAVMEEIVRRDTDYFREHYGGDTVIANRNHCLGWKGYVDLPRIYEDVGVVLDTNVLSIHDQWLQYTNGSGHPGKFVDTDGDVIQVYQQLTQAYDDASVKAKLSSDPVGEAKRTRQVMVDKKERYFSPLTMLSHPVSFYTYSGAYQNQCWDYANELGLPIWSAFEWADFVRARDRAQVAHSAWDDGSFSCQVAGSSPSGSFTLMVPLQNGETPRASVDGESVDVSLQEAYGWTYALVPVPISSNGPETRQIVVQT